jgi:predicted nucleic acid-binding protein
VTRFFLDTNIVAYADDLDAPGKQAVALDLLGRAYAESAGVISLQVLQEYFVTATRKRGVAPADARRKVELLARLETVRLDGTDVLAAIDLQGLHGLSFWDALIIQAALLARCGILYSEDLQHGFRLGSLQIVNPFQAFETVK